MSDRPTIPIHGIGERKVSWDLFFKFLDSLVVSVPEAAEGEPPDGYAVGLLMARVQNNRQKLEALSRLVDQRVATTRRQLSIAVEQLRTERAILLRAEDHPNSAHAKARVESMTAHVATNVAGFRARLADFEGARDSVRSQMKTMETCKQTLNSIRSLILGGVSPDGDEFTGRSSRSSR